MKMLPKTAIRISCLFLLPVALIILSISFHISIGRRMEIIKNDIRMIATFNRLEQSVRSLEQWLDNSRQNRVDQPPDVYWQNLYENYQRKRAAFIFDDYNNPKIEHLIAQVDSLVVRMDNLRQTIQKTISNKTITVASEKKFREAVQLAGLSLKEATDMAETEITATFTNLLSKWQFVNILVWVTYFIATLLAVMVVVFSYRLVRQKRTETELREGEKWYRCLVELSPEAITVHSDGKIFYVNTAGVKVFGATTPEDLIDKPVMGFVHPDSRKAVEESLDQLYKERKTVELMEEKFVRLDGQVLNADVTLVPIYYQGKPAVLSVVRDISRYKQDQEELKKYHDRLDELVRQRTQELTKLNQQLEHEINERKQAEQALQQKVTQIKTFVNNLPDMAWVKDIDSHFVLVNQAFAAAVGMEPESLIGQTCEVCFGKERAKKFRDDDLAVMNSGNQVVIEESIVDSNGNRKLLETIKSPILDECGKVIGTVGVARDISRRKQAEEELRRHRDHLDELVKERTAELTKINEQLQHEIAKHRETLAALEESERNYRTMFKSTGTATVIIDEDKTLSTVNSQFEKLSGYSREEVEGKKNWTEFVVKEDLDRMTEYHQLRRVVDGAAPKNYEFRFIDRYGNIKDIFLTIDVIPGTRKSVASLLDITKRKRAEQALRESEERYRRLVELSPMAIGIHSEGKLIYANPAALKMFGATPLDTARGMSVFDLVHPDDHETVKKRLQQLYVEETPTEPVEMKMIRRTGEILCAEIISTPIHYQGKPAGMVVLRDITERKRAEIQQQESEHKLRRQNMVLVELASRKTLHSGDLTSALKEITQTDAATLEVERVSVWLFDKNRTVIRCLDLYEWSKDHHSEGIELAAADYPAYFKALETERAIAADDAHTDPRTKEFSTSYLTPLGISSMMDAPIRLSGQIVGVICHEHIGTKRKWTNEEKNFAGSMADLVALALEAFDRKQAEAKLQELAAFPENNPDVVLTLDGKANVLYKNPASIKILKELGFAEEQIRLFLPDSIEQIVSDCLSSNQRLSDVEKSLSGKTWTWTFHPLRSQNIVHCYAADITERIKNEQELKKLSAAVIQSANMIIITDPNGVIEYVNPQFTRVTGYTLTEAIGQSIDILKSGMQDDEFYKELSQTIKSGKTWTGNVQNRRKNGELYWQRQSIAPIFDENGSIINFLSVAEDITSEILAQQKLVEADKMSAVGMLAAGVAHEFKNYLTGIIGNASFALSELEQEGDMQLAQETLTKIVELGERANDVAMSLLTYSKADPEDFNREDIKKIITKSISLVEKEMKNLSIEIVTYFEEVPEVEISASKIQQLLLNLLINAQHAIKSDGVITIALLRGDDHIKIKVGDTGVGIPPRNLTKIFDPFFSTKGVWGKDELVGTGMGLSICRNIAREHNGDLSVESIVGVGTTFTLTLPVNRHEETAAESAFKKSQDYNVLIFTLDKSIVSYYFEQACQVKAQIILVDDITKLPENFSQMTDLVICDAKFTGKVELYRMVEACRNGNVPYIMVNCGTIEYQLADLYENSAANFKQLPDFSRIISTTAVSISKKATWQFV